MSTISRAAALLAGAALAVTAMPVAAHAAEPAPAEPTGPLRVLVTGDSITQGYHGDYSWRYRLSQEFARQGVAVDFVGPTDHPFIWDGYTASRYAAPFDSAHFARVGAWLSGQANKIGEQVAAHQPDVVVVASGVNDLLYDTPPEVMARQTFPKWVRGVRGAKPDTRIVVSPVLATDRPATDPHAPEAARTYNRLLRTEVVPALSTDASPITVAGTDAGFDPVGFTMDGIHLNPSGETFVASKVAAHLHDLGILPAAPAAPQRLAWRRTATPTVRVSDNRLAVRWDGQATSYATLYVRDAAGSHYRTVRGASAAVTVPRGSTATVRVRLTRARVTGLWGPAVVRRTRPPTVARVSVRPRKVTWSHARGATSYRVKFRVGGRWATRTTTAHALYVRRVAAVYVTAQNSAGSAAARFARR